MTQKVWVDLRAEFSDAWAKYHRLPLTISVHETERRFQKPGFHGFITLNRPVTGQTPPSPSYLCGEFDVSRPGGLKRYGAWMTTAAGMNETSNDESIHKEAFATARRLINQAGSHLPPEVRMRLKVFNPSTPFAYWINLLWFQKDCFSRLAQKAEYMKLRRGKRDPLNMKLWSPFEASVAAIDNCGLSSDKPEFVRRPFFDPEVEAEVHSLIGYCSVNHEHPYQASLRRRQSKEQGSSDHRGAHEGTLNVGGAVLSPKWDEETESLMIRGRGLQFKDRQLLFGDDVIKTYTQQAQNQIAILDQFQSNEWKERLERIVYKVQFQGVTKDIKLDQSQVSKACVRLNLIKQCPIKFRGDGTGCGVRWELKDAVR